MLIISSKKRLGAEEVSYGQISGKKQVLLSQLSIVLFALIAGLLGRGGATYWLFVIVYFIAFTYIMMRASRPKQSSKANINEIESAKVLLEESKAFELMNQDKEYMKEMSEQMRMAQANMLLMLPIMLYFAVAYGPITKTVPAYFTNAKVGAVVAFLILFEGSFLLSRLGQWYVERGYRKRGFKPVVINVPRAFRVTTLGIVTYGFASKQALQFPLRGFSISLNAPRKFVDLVQESEKATMKLRLYTSNPERLYEILKRRVEQEEGPKRRQQDDEPKQ